MFMFYLLFGEVIGKVCRVVGGYFFIVVEFDFIERFCFLGVGESSVEGVVFILVYW